jgi:hypothetical protein
MRDMTWNGGRFDAEAHARYESLHPTRAEIGVGSVWEILDEQDRYPGAWKVTKVNPKTVLLVDETGRQLKSDVYGLVRTELKFVEKPNVYRPHIGHVVTSSVLKSRTHDTSTKLFVFKIAGDVANCIPVGEDSTSYYKLPVVSLTQYRGTITV